MNGIACTATLSSHRPSATPSGWNQLPREERRRQIRELMASCYWSVLPADIRERFIDLYQAC